MVYLSKHKYGYINLVALHFRTFHMQTTKSNLTINHTKVMRKQELVAVVHLKDEIGPIGLSLGDVDLSYSSHA